MKNEYEEIASAIRVEHDEMTGELLIVFRVTNEKYKQFIKKNWTKDILFRVMDKKLTIFEDK